MEILPPDSRPQHEEVEWKLSPIMRVALKAVFSDTVEEFSMIHKAASCGASVLQTLPEGEEGVEKNSDTLIKELNRIFFETLVRFERCRQEDYIALPDGSFRKLNEEESNLRTFLEEVKRVIDIFQILEREIDVWGTFKSLRMHCDDKQAIVDMPLDLAKTIMDKDQMIKFMHEKIHQIEKHFENQRLLYDEVIRRLKHEWQEARQLSLMSYKYLKASYRQRADHYSIICDEETRALSDSAQNFRQRLNTEKRLINETSSSLFGELDLQANHLKYLQGLTRVEDLSSELDALTASLEKLRKDHENLKLEYAQCEQVVLDHKTAEEKRRLEEENNQKTLVAIFQVQAWWRAIMVMQGIKAKSKRRGGKQKKGKKA
ncbi:hypothetical protein ECG_07520 [Echinococcus granulosus]|uniref:Dynein regulatory complex protein 10 n=1 Tax=Echinococcus granulosus TaxID=6210 RepID=U6JK70_ECHGR|nr:hypothetical protein EGR_05395 [Echinococcus granulosus]EUB59775.1 hypothetical protein EGR_05395 [Echinococcus granulosus]KAH9279526.1 hypothetical protein ECG_07520 [Echinococcus granulosus]CDS24508.1 hypothetical protein EgrG_000391100 [Echinococcus granulosus]